MRYISSVPGHRDTATATETSTATDSKQITTTTTTMRRTTTLATGQDMLLSLSLLLPLLLQQPFQNGISLCHKCEPNRILATRCQKELEVKVEVVGGWAGRACSLVTTWLGNSPPKFSLHMQIDLQVCIMCTCVCVYVCECVCVTTHRHTLTLDQALDAMQTTYAQYKRS